MKTKYYLLTTKENAEIILKEGLKPITGNRLKIIDDKREGIFLCKKKDIPYWQIILNLPVVLSISDIEIDEECVYHYINYNEYVYEEEIPANKIKRSYCDIFMNKSKAMHDLCILYIRSLSRFTVDCAKYYFYNKTDEKLYEIINREADTLIYVLKNLDYSSCSKKEIKDALIQADERGNYTFCDRYLNTSNQLFTQLIYYPHDKLFEKRDVIYRYIKENFEDVLLINTGSWCG